MQKHRHACIAEAAGEGETEAQAAEAEAEAAEAEAGAEATAEAEAHAEVHEKKDAKLFFVFFMILGVQGPPRGSFEKGTKFFSKKLVRP